MIFKLLNWQGIAGIGVSLALTVLLFVQRAETSHWRNQSTRFEKLYYEEKAAFTATVADTRAAAERARAADQANAARVAAEQRRINERTTDDFETRIAAARADAQRLRLEPRAAADPGAGRDSSMSRVSPAAAGAAQTAGQDELPRSDALTATEQAIQLDELIKWVRAQAAVRPDEHALQRN
jgi:hypothetical protein